MTPKTWHTFALFGLALALAAPAATAQRRAQAGKARAAGKALVFLDSTRERDGLRGPVRRVRTEVARLTSGAAGAPAEGPRRLLEVTVYDASGRRVENATYPVVSSPAGGETNLFDERGNLAETVLSDAAGRVISRTVYAYEFDRRGNWTKMTASLSVDGPGGPALEPVEVTYRAITYYSPDTAEAPAHSAGTGDGAPAGRVAPAASPAPTTPATTAPAAATTATTTPRATLVGPEPKATPAGGAATATTADAPAATTGAAQAPAGAGAADDFSSLPDAGLLNQKASSLPPPAFPVGPVRPARGLVLVVVEVVVDEAGRVLSARAPSGPEALREAAEEAARRAVFAPFVAGGVPRRVRGTIRYTFPYEP